MTATLVAFRHAPCAVAGLCYGRTDPPLTMDAGEAAESILKHLTITPDIVWTSPTLRCKLPGQIVAQANDAPIRIDDRLCELDFGDWEARPWKEIQRDDGDRLEMWMAAWLEQPPPGGESTKGLEDRVRQWWLALDPTIHHVLVGHAGVMRALQVIANDKEWVQAMEESVAWLRPYYLPLPTTPRSKRVMR